MNTTERAVYDKAVRKAMRALKKVLIFYGGSEEWNELILNEFKEKMKK